MNYNFFKEIKKHLEENKMTYSEHYMFATFYGLLAIIAGFYLLVHALVPCLFQNAGADLVKKLSTRFNKKT